MHINQCSSGKDRVRYGDFPIIHVVCLRVCWEGWKKTEWKCEFMCVGKHMLEGKKSLIKDNSHNNPETFGQIYHKEWIQIHIWACF